MTDDLLAANRIEALPATPPAVGEKRRFASFMVTGGIAAGANLAARWLLSHVLAYAAAVAIAYVIGMTVAFLLARRFVFSGSGTGWFAEYRRFAAVNVVSGLVVLGVSVGLARGLFPAIGLRWHADDVAHLIGVVSPIALSYYAHKHYSFGARGAS